MTFTLTGVDVRRIYPSLRHQPEVAQRELDQLGASIAATRARVGLPPSDPFDIAAIRSLRRGITAYQALNGVIANRVDGNRASVERREGESDWDMAVRAYRMMQHGTL